MKITKQWLLDKPADFWNKLFFILFATAPYFGKLDWKVKKELDINHVYFQRLSSEYINYLKSSLEGILNNANEEQVCRSLMTFIFWVAPDYNRTLIEPITYDYDEYQRGLLSSLGTDRLPKYPAYFVTSAPDNYRPLKLEEIQAEDIRMFKMKVKLAGTPSHKELVDSVLEGYKSLKEYYQQRENKVKQKLIEWINLLDDEFHDAEG